MTGEENAGQSAKNERGGAKGEGEIRGGASGNQSVQSEVYGGHDASVWKVSGNGGATTTVLQRRSLRHSQMSEYFAGSSVSFLFHYYATTWSTCDNRKFKKNHPNISCPINY